MKIKNVLVILFIMIYTMSVFMNIYSVKANISEGDTLLLKGDHECDSLLEYWMEDYNKWSYKVVWYVYYTDLDTKETYPAFCIEPAKNGVGTGYEEYNTTVKKELDNSIWRILDKGYMGSNYSQWDLECDDDLYSATKVALHCYADKIQPIDKYIIGTRSVDGNTVEEIQRRGQKVLDVAQILYEYGINGKEEYSTPKVEIQEINEAKTEIIEDIEYYIKEYKVKANKQLKDYEIEISNFIKGTKILKEEDKFKIAIPTLNIKDTIKGTIKVKDAQVKTNPIYYCKSSIEGAQSYITYTSSYETAEDKIELEVKSNNCKLELQKISASTEEPLEGVEFEIYTKEGINLGKYITDKDGKIKISNLKPGEIVIKEIATKEGYELDKEEKIVKLEWGKISNIIIENKKTLPRTGF